MSEGVAQGPVVEFKPRPKQIPPGFIAAIDDLRKWRNEDHADAIQLHRNRIITIIEGVDALMERA